MSLNKSDLCPDERDLEHSSFNNSIISLNGLNREGANNVKSILEEILNNDQFDSKEESLDIFAQVDLDDKVVLSSLRTNFNLNNSKNNSLNNYEDVAQKLKGFEEIIALKDTTIANLTSQLDSFREMVSNPSSGTSTTEYKQYQEECHNKVCK